MSMFEIWPENSKILTGLIVRTASSRTPSGTHLSTLDIAIHSHENETLRDNVDISQHLEDCPLCKDFFDRYHSRSHPDLSTLAYYVLGYDYWDPIKSELKESINCHIQPEEHRWPGCQHCHKIVKQLELLSLPELYRLKNNDPIILERYTHITKIPNRSQAIFVNAVYDTMLGAHNSIDY